GAAERATLAAQPVRGGSLAYGEFGRPSTLDPITNNEMTALRLAELMFNGLVAINARQEIVPDLAARWDVADGGRRYVFDLRPDVVWHDGQPFTADDVVFTYQVVANPKTVSSLRSRYEFIETVRRLDDHRVEVVLKRPILNALGKLTFKIIPKHALAGRDYLTRTDPFVQQPIGTGPYRLERVTGDGEYVLVANERYFKGRPNIDQIVMRPFADQNIMTQALLFNAIDLIVQVSPKDLPEIDGDRRFVLTPYNALSYSFFAYNLRHPVLADRRVRQAITYAINRQEMLDAFFGGRGTLISGPFAPGSWAYNLDVKPYPFDPARARALLAEAGLADASGDGVLEKDGQPVRLTLKVPIEKESDSVKRVVLAFQNYLKGVGLDVRPEFREWQAWKEDVFGRQEFDIVYGSWVFDDAADISSLFHSGEVGPWRNNFVGYSNPEVDALIVEAKVTLDREKRRSINQKLHAILADEQPYTFLWTLTNYAASHRKIRRLSIQPYAFFTFVDEWFIAEGDQRARR
ncbi:MAG TPA: ABC transporter substrate-binding protein, partial [Thermodesulfobacteriota bacterium]|nr:ABC transporter substrate-binding protein [Thermodesulfobacteriota bacterium]